MLLRGLASCPLCVDAPHELARNGHYCRGAVVDGESTSIVVYRKKCTVQDTSFALLPGDLVLPRAGYPRDLVLERLWASLEGSSYRNREFLVEHGLELPAPDKQISWSDSLDSSACRPGYGLMWQWTRAFDIRAQQVVATLLLAFRLLGLDLYRDLAIHLKSLQMVQPRAYWLALALGLWRALLEASCTDGHQPDLKEALPTLVDILLCSSSHTIIRVFSPSSGYREDAAGRSPPIRAAHEGAP